MNQNETKPSFLFVNREKGKCCEQKSGKSVSFFRLEHWHFGILANTPTTTSSNIE